MKQLVNMEVDESFLLQKIDDPVHDQFNGSEEATAGYKPDSSGVDEGVGTKAIQPKALAWKVIVLWAVVPVFVECEEPPLKRMVAQCMSDKQCKEDGQCCRKASICQSINVM